MARCNIKALSEALDAGARASDKRVLDLAKAAVVSKAMKFNVDSVKYHINLKPHCTDCLIYKGLYMYHINLDGACSDEA